MWVFRGKRHIVTGSGSSYLDLSYRIPNFGLIWTLRPVLGRGSKIVNLDTTSDKNQHIKHPNPNVFYVDILEIGCQNSRKWKEDQPIFSSLPKAVEANKCKK